MNTYFLILVILLLSFLVLTLNVDTNREKMTVKLLDENNSVNIYIFCFNEEVLLPHTIEHYKKYLPNSNITIVDNMSNDNSINIAKKLGCNIIQFNTGDQMNNYVKQKYANNVWKKNKKGWVIVADMDEWLCVNEKDLINENYKGSTILKVKGVNMIGESILLNLKDIDLHKINYGIDNKHESKSMCFNVKYIKDMNYDVGQHNCNPNGIIKYSNKIYLNKHMEYLGLNWILNKRKNRLLRRNKNHINLSSHYIKSPDEVKKEYINSLKNSYFIEN